MNHSQSHENVEITVSLRQQIVFCLPKTETPGHDVRVFVDYRQPDPKDKEVKISIWVNIDACRATYLLSIDKMPLPPFTPRTAPKIADQIISYLNHKADFYELLDGIIDAHCCVQDMISDILPDGE